MQRILFGLKDFEEKLEIILLDESFMSLEENVIENWPNVDVLLCFKLKLKLIEKGFMIFFKKINFFVIKCFSFKSFKICKLF